MVTWAWFKWFLGNVKNAVLGRPKFSDFKSPEYTDFGKKLKKDTKYQQPVFSPTEQYALGLLTEESGEISQMVGKAFRFGLDTPGRKDAKGVVIQDITPRTELAKECGDLQAAIDWAIMHGIIDNQTFRAQYTKKRLKLSNPEELDNLGRQLTPRLYRA